MPFRNPPGFLTVDDNAKMLRGLTAPRSFTKDGRASLTMLGQSLQGTYKVNGDELEWTLNGKTVKGKVKVTATELQVTSEGNTVTYKKV